MAERKPISKKLRFDIFKRDYFTCVYCGNTPPKVILEIDHIVPISKNGSNEQDNLVTACFDCNRGKSANELSSIPQSVIEKNIIQQEKETQYLEYKKFQSKIIKRAEKEVDDIEKYYQPHFGNYGFTNKFRLSVKRFINDLGYYEVLDAMEKSCQRLDFEQSLKYFCGICWNKINKT